MITVFAIHGVFVGIASVLFATQLSVIQSTVPPNLELTIITASVVGGVSIMGGTGTVIGSTLAAILLAAIGSADEVAAGDRIRTELADDGVEIGESESDAIDLIVRGIRKS